MQDFDEAVVSSRDGKARSNASINRKLAAVRSLLTFGCDKIRVLPTNVGAVVDGRPVKDVLAQRILTEEQVFRMFALEDNQRNVALLRFRNYSGLKKNNDLQSRTKVKVECEETETNQSKSLE